MKPEHLIKLLIDFGERFPKIRIDEIRIDYEYCTNNIIVDIKALRNEENLTAMGSLNAGSINAILKIDREGDLYNILWQPVSFSYGFEWGEVK